MKTFIISYNTNYGLGVMIINSLNLESARILAKSSGAWDRFEIEELDKKTEGLVFHE